MHIHVTFLAATATVFSQLSAAETVVGAFIFARHGDRTSKSTPPTDLTDLGYSEIYQTGNYYRGRYISSSATSQIAGINPDLVKLSQLSVSSPADDVLQSSAMGFLQGLYPPVGSSATETLRNGTNVTSPMDGYQIIPLSLIDTGSNSENAGWLQSTDGCATATISSNNYFSSAEYNSLLKSTADFYTSLTPMLNRTFSSSKISFKNAYTIFDYLNVANIHNSSANFPSSDLLTDQTYHQLLTLANTHEFNLAYNASDEIRAVAGKVLAGEIVDALNETITTSGKSKLTIQFGAYATFQSLFGLAKLPAADPDFYGMPDYASSMVFELVTNSTAAFPSESDLSVRFLFKNGTAKVSAAPEAYPLFGQSETLLSWSDFVSGMGKFSISSDEQWCTACGNSTGTCAAYASSPTGSASVGSTSHSGGMSNAVAGVIGAMVTLGVILGIEALVLVVGGFRLAKKRSSGAAGAAGAVGGGVAASEGSEKSSA